ncbi:MAG: GNAT family N-acetyltransferase [Chloroflexota bacterium]
MVKLIPMTDAEFEDFIQLSIRGFVQDRVQAGEWRAEEAEGKMEALRDQFLPAGSATPNHFFFAVKDASSGTQVGGLWYMLEEQDEQRQFFVMDIQIYEEHRRRGYGSQAFWAMEEKAREMGAATIALHVFKHNHKARAMYEKLGYTGTETKMSKRIAMA